jgi:putative transposase
MKYHFAAELRIYPSSQQKHIIAVNDGASRFVYNRMTANDRELHRLKKTAHLCPAYAGRIEYLEQVRSSKRELVNTIPFLNEKDVDSLAVDNAIKNHNLAWKRFREVPGTGIPGFHRKS